MHIFRGFASLVTLAIVLSGCSFSLTGDITPPPGSELPAPQQISEPTAGSLDYPLVLPDLADGDNLYLKDCARCHGEKGLGDGPQASQLSVPVGTLGLSNFAGQFSPAEWYKVVKQGDMERFMPAFPNLTDRQRWDVVAYAMSLSSSDLQMDQGKVLYDSECSSCHGISGNGEGPEATTLTTHPADFTNLAFMVQRSSSSLNQAIANGITPDMPAYASSLDENQRQALISYIRSFTFAPAQSIANASPTTTSANIQPTSSAYPGSSAYPVAVTPTPVITSTAEVTPAAPILGSVTIQLVNGSGGETPSNEPVTLYGFDKQNTYSETLTTGENGVYTFTNVLMPEGRVFLASTDFASGTYGSDIVTVDPANPNLNLQITIYDTTTDVSLLTTDRVHVFFDFTNPQNVQVIEVFIISNPSKQAVVSPATDGTVVTFPLPKGYTNLQFESGGLGDRYVEVSQGFADKMTVNPGVGQYQVIFAFQMPYDQKLDFAQPMFLPTSAVVVMVPDNGVKLSSNMLQDGGTRDYQGTTYRMYNGSSLIAGSSLEFSLSGNPKQVAASFFSTGSTQNLAIGVGVFGVILVLAGVWLYRQNQNKLAWQQATTSMDNSSFQNLEGSLDDEETLMDAIITLDDQFHAGNIPEEAYLERRSALKEKLKKLDQG